MGFGKGVYNDHHRFSKRTVSRKFCDGDAAIQQSRGFAPTKHAEKQQNLYRAKQPSHITPGEDLKVVICSTGKKLADGDG